MTTRGVKIAQVPQTPQRFICSYQNCGKRYCSKQRLTLHIDVKHLGIGRDRFRCFQCTFTTYEKSGLKQHVRKHTGEKPYLCQYCPKEFSCAGNRNDHEKRHLNLKIYICAICQTGFYRNYLRVKHEIKCQGIVNTQVSVQGGTRIALNLQGSQEESKGSNDQDPEIGEQQQRQVQRRSQPNMLDPPQQPTQADDQYEQIQTESEQIPIFQQPSLLNYQLQNSDYEADENGNDKFSSAMKPIIDQWVARMIPQKERQTLEIPIHRQIETIDNPQIQQQTLMNQNGSGVPQNYNNPGNLVQIPRLPTIESALQNYDLELKESFELFEAERRLKNCVFNAVIKKYRPHFY